ncbi:hypothetical protein ZIOFF_057830 [Zingiber officinale]|uniref:Uncharacterized protein n=1 Tax=Zingiber officinale TaxID=94328 RepID=A0A8J5KH87_ZINOF|nr:hypothetical protein ZIOFF_057830 [Zingiber officinale]
MSGRIVEREDRLSRRSVLPSGQINQVTDLCCQAGRSAKQQSGLSRRGKCVVHTFKNYIKLDNVDSEDCFCRFDYKAATGFFTPDRVAVYGIYSLALFQNVATQFPYHVMAMPSCKLNLCLLLYFIFYSLLSPYPFNQNLFICVADSLEADYLDRFHPSCMGIAIEQAKKLDCFLCSDCDSESEARRSMNGFAASPVSETKVI